MLPTRLSARAVEIPGCGRRPGRAWPCPPHEGPARPVPADSKPERSGSPAMRSRPRRQRWRRRPIRRQGARGSAALRAMTERSRLTRTACGPAARDTGRRPPTPPARAARAGHWEAPIRGVPGETRSALRRPRVAHGQPRPGWEPWAIRRGPVPGMRSLTRREGGPGEPMLTLVSEPEDLLRIRRWRCCAPAGRASPRWSGRRVHAGLVSVAVSRLRPADRLRRDGAGPPVALSSASSRPSLARSRVGRPVARRVSPR